MHVATTFQRVPLLCRGRLTQDEVNRYLTAIATQLPLLGEERDELLTRLRRWAETDDGKPVYMLNLMRYYDPPRAYPGAPTDFSGTSEQANAHYERGATPLVLRRCSYPLLGGRAQGTTLTSSGPGLDDWSRVLVMRYPSRRAFLDLLADPAYAPLWPYKAMAVQLMLLPISGDLVVPDFRVLIGGAAISLLLGAGWLRAALNRQRISRQQDGHAHPASYSRENVSQRRLVRPYQSPAAQSVLTSITASSYGCRRTCRNLAAVHVTGRQNSAGEP